MNENSKLRGGCGGENENPFSVLKDAAAKARTAKRPPELKLPPKERPDMSPSELLLMKSREALELDVQVAACVGEWMKNVSLPELDRIQELENLFGPDLLERRTGEKNKKGEEVTYGQKKEEYIEWNDSYFNGRIEVREEGHSEDEESPEKEEKPLYLDAFETRKAAHMAFLEHILGSENEASITREELTEKVKLCVEDGYFIEDSAGPIRVWQRSYRLSPDKRFGKLGGKEQRLIAEIIGNHVYRINAFYKGSVQQEAEKLQEQSEISLQELIAGREGKCFVHVPATTTREGYRLSEVYLLVEGKGGDRALILDAVGPDARTALEIRDKKMFLLLFTLGASGPPGVNTLMEKGFPREDAEKVRRFWGYLHRADIQQREKEEAERNREVAQKARQEREETTARLLAESEALKEEYKRECTIALDRVLMGEKPMSGIFFGEFNGIWNNPNGTTIPKGLLYFQGEQVVNDDGAPSIRVKKAPSHLVNESFFRKGCLEFKPYGETFEGLDQPLQGLMRALYRQVKNQTEVA